MRIIKATEEARARLHAQCSVARGPTPGTVGHSVTVTRHEPWAHGSSIPIAMRCVVVMALARPGETPKHEHAQQAQHNETPDPPAMGRPARTSYFGTVDRRALGRWRGGGVVDGVPRGGRGRGLGFGIVTFEIGDGGTDESDRLFLAPDAHTRGASVTDHRRAVILVEMVVLARHVCGRLGVFWGVFLLVVLSLSNAERAGAISGSFVIPDRAPKHRSRLDAVSGGRGPRPNSGGNTCARAVGVVLCILFFFFSICSL